ncbi:MAG TPA: hypothetical protein VFT47_12235 [Vicinamibacterales bacterium]|nr:hypothetical protein [Vicinamibacterales bacterium]
MCDDRIVDVNWPPERIKEFCENNGNWVLFLDSRLTPADIEALYRRQLTVPEPHAGLIGEIGGDQRTPVWVLEDIVGRFRWSVEVLSSIATNPASPRPVLEQLRQHEHSVIVEDTLSRTSHVEPGGRLPEVKR